MFNVINDPWIKVKTGNVYEKLCLRELLERANEIGEVYDTQAMVEFGMYRFLTAFVADAYRLGDEADRANLFDEGAFDMDVIDKYIETCQKEGVSFEALDPIKPFFQEAIDEEVPIVNVSKLNLEPPKGELFIKNKEKKADMAIDEVMRNIITTPLFPKGGSGYGSNIDRTDYFFLAKGRNLFETIVLNIIPEEEREDYGLPYWRMDSPVIINNDKDKRTKFKAGYLDGLTFPLRYVNITEENGSVKDIRFGPGLKMAAKAALWKSPYSAYKRVKEKVEPVKSGASSSVAWLDIKTLFKSAVILPEVIDKNKGEDLCYRSVVTYSIQANGAKVLQMSRNEFILPGEIFTNETIKTNISNAIDTIEKEGKYLEKVFKYIYQLQTERPKDQRVSSYIIAQYLNVFYDKCRAEFNEQISHKVPDVNEWIKKINTEAYKSIAAFEKGYCNDAAMIAKVEKEIRKHFKKGGKMKKKEKEEKDVTPKNLGLRNLMWAN